MKQENACKKPDKKKTLERMENKSYEWRGVRINKYDQPLAKKQHPDLRKRIDFYNNYKTTSIQKGYEKLIEDHIRIYELFLRHLSDSSPSHGTIDEIYNNWLLNHLCFKKLDGSFDDILKPP